MIVSRYYYCVRPSSNVVSHEVKLETGATYTIVLGEENEEVCVYIHCTYTCTCMYTVNGDGNLMMLEMFCILLAKCCYLQ